MNSEMLIIITKTKHRLIVKEIVIWIFKKLRMLLENDFKYTENLIETKIDKPVNFMLYILYNKD